MKFIVDTQLPPKLAWYLNKRGFDTAHTTDFPQGFLLKDSEIVVIAKEEDRTVITKDSDFSDQYFLFGAPPRILLLKFGNISNKELILFFDLYFHRVVEAFENGSDYVQFGPKGIVAG